VSLLFSINSSELDQLQEYLEKIKSSINLSDLKVKQDLKERLQAVMFEDMRLRFASSPGTQVGGTVYGGQEWSSLSEYYLANNPNRQSGQVYIDTHDLMNSLVSMTSNTVSEFEETSANGADFVFGTKLKYAEKLQQSRPIVFMHPELLDKVVKGYEELIINN
jgi:hypothetical protein